MLDLHESHFRMLRLAIYRRLKCDQLSANVFQVSSSRPNHPPYKVDAVGRVCPCDAVDYCSHLALALDRWMSREAGVETRGEYIAARHLDFGSLHLRGGLRGNDRRFLRARAESVSARLEGELVTVGAGRTDWSCPF